MGYNITPAIEEELAKIDRSKNRFFDSHYIIKQLIKNHTDEYLSYAASIGADGELKKVETIHGLLAQEIKKCTELVRDTGMNISSENIHGSLSANRVWEKVGQP